MIYICGFGSHLQYTNKWIWCCFSEVQGSPQIVLYGLQWTNPDVLNSKETKAQNYQSIFCSSNLMYNSGVTCAVQIILALLQTDFKIAKFKIYYSQNSICSGTKNHEDYWKCIKIPTMNSQILNQILTNEQSIQEERTVFSTNWIYTCRSVKHVPYLYKG